MKAATGSFRRLLSSLTISIHAAREGGDYSAVNNRKTRVISIHAAREGGDQKTATAASHGMKFQSTPPVKAATRILK